SVIPNAGLPNNTGVGEAVYPLEPAPMAKMLGEFVSEFGVRIVGGCCGTRPEHLAAVVSAVDALGVRVSVDAVAGSAITTRGAPPETQSNATPITSHHPSTATHTLSPTPAHHVPRVSSAM